MDKTNNRGKPQRPEIRRIAGRLGQPVDRRFIESIRTVLERRSA